MKRTKLNAGAAGILAVSMLLSPLTAAADSGGTFQYDRDTWRFYNQESSFQTAYLDNLFPEHKRALDERLNHVEYHLMEPMLEWDTFHGACYGFAVTSMLAAYDILNPDEHLDELALTKEDAAHVTGDLYSLDRLQNGSASLHPYYEQSLLTYYQLLQNTDAIRQEGVQKSEWTIRQKLDFLTDKGAANMPVLLIYNGICNGRYFGHAVVAFGAETGKWPFVDAYAKGDYDTRILIYDSNNQYYGNAQTDRVFELGYLYYNSITSDWTVPVYGISQENCNLLGLVDDSSIVNDKGILPGTEYTPPAWTDVIATNALESPYAVTIPDSGKALSERPWFYLDGDEAVRQNFVSDTADSSYQIKVEQPQQLHSGVYYKNLAFQCDMQSGKQICYDPSGSVSVSGDASAYALTMILNEDYPTQWYDITVSGIAGNAILQKMKDGYLLTADDLQNTSLTARNFSSRTMVTISTDAKSVLFSETNSGQFAASADLDGDGSFETELARSLMLGDLNGDQTVNASDAALLLIAAARIGAGEDSSLTKEQEIAADVDYDRRINASDSANILIYAANAGAGSFSGTLAAFMQRGESFVHCET